MFNNINFSLKGRQIGAFHQRYLKCKCETPYFEGELVQKKPAKVEKCPPNFFPEWFGH